ncbi:hypothetical protein A3A93_00910 [Candidatus Roizmanbacteria bacterium RIFCSPLOWO2_01_FULL_38_12]|uniref:Peptidase M41 FtsH extracellular domain-containing protein n=1 Tax=Candidatus Roizmanbacteria bacterium RIFCSPLOWO2_01_FULL_38_12 TaxID=1802061 RepID=A0A1F7IR60_9BACT|nr:MAG: hypothetical protein A3F59_05490 [Candidatus Roizmanbacteria bacterium RIFCSPHIGHO2_12_FULL_38_13]OGK45845.1 MAG: hypothetical protein A3A93_00910 [Candidatus Roizmanbacteria bacterium RIFCSPLOWO2_01_FULL_38_12]
MSKGNIYIRLVLLVVVTFIFITFFYFFFKNSRASSPLNDEEYMEQLSVLSNKYNVVSPVIASPTPSVDVKSKKKGIDFLQIFAEFVVGIFDKVF